MDSTAALAPVGGYSADVHESEVAPLFLYDRQQRQARSEPGQHLAEARHQVGTEVQDSAVDRERVEPVGPCILSPPGWAHPQRIVTPRHSPESSLGRSDDLGPSITVTYPPAMNALAAARVSLSRPSRIASAGESSSSCGFMPMNHARTT